MGSVWQLPPVEESVATSSEAVALTLGTDTGEWVEIWNSGQSDMDLTGWSITDNAGNILAFNESHLIGSSMTITPDELDKKFKRSGF